MNNMKYKINFLYGFLQSKKDWSTKKTIKEQTYISLNVSI